MKIIKYEKKNKTKYKVYLENGDSLELYEDIILKNELLLKKKIENIDTLIDENNKYTLYLKTLDFVNKKIRSEKEIRKYLEKYSTDVILIDDIINRLYENNLLNNELYLKSYIRDKIKFTKDGPNKIKKNLLDLGFNILEIENMLIDFDDNLQLEKIENYINKYLNNNTKSLKSFKQKMFLNLMYLGYDKEIIIKALNKIDFSEEELKEKEKKKLLKKYSKKYSELELDRIIKKKLFERGFEDNN